MIPFWIFGNQAPSEEYRFCGECRHCDETRFENGKCWCGLKHGYSAEPEKEECFEGAKDREKREREEEWALMKTALFVVFGFFAVLFGVLWILNQIGAWK